MVGLRTSASLETAGTEMDNSQLPIRVFEGMIPRLIVPSQVKQDAQLVLLNICCRDALDKLISRFLSGLVTLNECAWSSTMVRWPGGR